LDGAAETKRITIDEPTLDPTTLNPSDEAIPARPLQRARPRRAEPIGLTPDGRLKSGPLAGLSMGRAVWVVSWPVLVESLLNSLVGLTDTVLAAQLSEPAADAIGGASYVLWFIGLVIMAIGVGATALISRAVGGGRLAVANAAVGQSLLLAAASGALVAMLVTAGVEPAAVMLNLSAEGRAAFQSYMYTVCLGVPFMALIGAMTACMRGSGDSLRPLIAMVVVNAINIPLSWILAGVDLTATKVVGEETVTRTVLHNPFGFDLGIRGVAIGTVVAEVVGMLVILGMVIRGRGGVRLRARRLRPHWHTLMRLVRVGIPNFLETFGMWVGNFMVILMVGLLGSQGMLGSHVMAARIEAFSYLPGFALGAAAATLTGQYLGAGSEELARRSILACTAITSVIMGAMGVLFMLCPTAITGLVSSQPTHLEIVPDLLFVAGVVQIPFGIGIVLRTALRGAGDVKAVMWITWLTTYGVRLPLAYFLSGVDIALPRWLGGGVIENPCPTDGLVWLWIGLCIEIVVRAAAFGARYAQGSWAKVRV
jgi:putative MATE family efflux protein